MGCDWSKTSAAADDMPNAPYTLLSVSVDQNGSYQGTPGAKGGRSRKRGTPNSKGCVTWSNLHFPCALHPARVALLFARGVVMHRDVNPHVWFRMGCCLS